MAFENVDTANLRNALNSCKTSIDDTITRSLINKLSGNNVWDTSSKDKVSEKIKILEEKRYKDLKEKIDKYLNLVPQIEEYQRLAQENNQSESSCQNMSEQLRKEKEKAAKEGKSYNGNINSEINNLNSQINSNKQRMKEIENYVSNSI